ILKRVKYLHALLDILMGNDMPATCSRDPARSFVNKMSVLCNRLLNAANKPRHVGSSNGQPPHFWEKIVNVIPL
ncbi:hypothetical protein MJ258_17315, partial [Legionella sp. EUR-108]|uniref:hypothetical protein n=1 Tax=Legionella maioricensis TaxID=2896528 RepID=UPI002027C266